MYRSVLLFLFVALVVSSCSRSKKDPCENQEPQHTITTTDVLVCFESVDSYDLDYVNKEKIIINGKLYFPDIKKDTYNAVILTHGSGGKRRYHNQYIDVLTDLGLIVFQLDHYAARKIKYDKTFSKVSG